MACETAHNMRGEPLVDIKKVIADMKERNIQEKLKEFEEKYRKHVEDMDSLKVGDIVEKVGDNWSGEIISMPDHESSVVVRYEDEDDPYNNFDSSYDVWLFKSIKLAPYFKKVVMNTNGEGQ